jgi:hypothetical protein
MYIIYNTIIGNIMTQSIAKKIIRRIARHGRGWVFSTKYFFDCGDRYAVNMALHRLRKSGVIRQVLRGVYDYPRFSKLFNTPASPDPNDVAMTIARSYGWTICPSGETALNLLRLSTQVPAKLRYFTDGPSKKYRWQGTLLELSHRAIKETGGLSPRTALVVQALKALGKEHSDKKVIAVLRKELSEKELQKALQETQFATNWVYDTLRRVAGKEEWNG